MSADMPYVVRLYFENGRGVARMHGFSRALEQAPTIDGLPLFDMIDYIPTVVAMIRPIANKVRDLEKHERAAVDSWLPRFRALW